MKLLVTGGAGYIGSVVGALLWVGLLVPAGYWFGNIPVVKNHFGFVSIGIILVSLIPVAWVALKKR